MPNLLLFLAAVNSAGCPQPRTVNWTTLPWTTQDTAVYSKAIERCKAHFGDTAPCLKTFIKKGEHTYYAICNQPHSGTGASSPRRNYWFTLSDTEVTERPNSGAGDGATGGQKCGSTCPARQQNKAGGN